MRRIALLLASFVSPLLPGSEAPSFGHEHAGKPCRWPGVQGQGITIRWSVRADFRLPGVTRDDAIEATRAAFDLWAAEADVQSIEVDEDAQANLLIGSDDLSRTWNESVSGACDYPCAAVGNRVRLALDSSERFWPVKLRKILVHEVGHSLGLGHVDAPLAIMNPYWDKGGDEATEPDRVGIRARYGPSRQIRE